MAYYDSHPQRGGNGEPGYFDDSQPSDYSRSAEPPPDSSPARERSTSNARQRSSPVNDRMTSSPERAEPAAYDELVAEITAEITERIKREGM
jgi:hypothetical protein